MVDSSRAYIKEIAQELALAMHQSKDKEVSGLFTEIRNNQENIKAEISSLRDEVKVELSSLRDEVEIVRGQVQPIIQKAEFWRMLWDLVKSGGNVLTWTVGVIVAILVLSGQAKTILLAWLASRTF